MTKTSPSSSPLSSSVIGPVSNVSDNTSAAKEARYGLLDLIDRESLQMIQDGFVDVTGLQILIRDSKGHPVTDETDLHKLRATDALLTHLLLPTDILANASTAPIQVDNTLLGSITIETDTTGRESAQNAAAVQFLQLLGNSIARLCAQEQHMMQRIDELSTLYKLSRILATHHDLQQVLDTAAREAAKLMNVKAVCIRLYDEDANEFVPRAVYNLSDLYLLEQTVLAANADIFRQAFDDQTILIDDMLTDPRVTNRQSVEREGLVSMLCAGLIYHDRALGVIQLFTGEPHNFTGFEIDLVKAMARLLAAAIESAKLEVAREQGRAMQRQLKLAADVQRRMLPRKMPSIPQFDVAARYVPSLELGGDFYDFIELDGHLGITVGDVVGKGVAAALLMSSVRSALRAYAQDLYDIDEIVSRVNTAMCRDTLDREFVTLFYGVIDPNTLRLTYSNAGHDPPMLLRDGEIQPLETGGMVVGIDPHAEYKKGIVDLKPGDSLLLFSDGLPDAMNFEGKRFSRQRIEKAFQQTSVMNTAKEAMNHVLWEMRRFVGMNTPSDDTTIVVLRVKES